MWIRVALDKSAIHSVEDGYTSVFGNEIEEYYFPETVADLLDKDGFLPEMWASFDSLIDWGDSDYFPAEKCSSLSVWLENRLQKNLPEPVSEVYGVMLDFCQKAIKADTGICFDF